MEWESRLDARVSDLALLLLLLLASLGLVSWNKLHKLCICTVQTGAGRWQTDPRVKGEGGNGREEDKEKQHYVDVGEFASL